MAPLLGSELEAFLASYDRPRQAGLRVNPLKTDCCPDLTPFVTGPISWARDGYFLRPGARPGLHPYHEAGLYYLQEPSAMAPAALLDPQPGERVLDLCAAPGGKSTQLAAAMAGRGLLVSNEINPKRARILSRNLERMGVSNALVLNEDPRRLQARFAGCFDKILVDAPCSGEGMFRKEPVAATQHNNALVEHCAALGAEILENAAAMLAPGGVLVYSTCTFAPQEDEAQIAAFLARHPEFTLCDLNACGFGRPGEENRAPGCIDITRCRRIWPADGGEGHFMAKLKKSPDAEAPVPVRVKPGKPAKTPPEWLDFVKTTFPFLADRPLTTAGDWLLLPVPGSELLNLSKLRIVRGGVLAGSVLKKRFQPAHALFMAYGARCTNREELTLDDPRTAAWLRGEEINAATAQNGWCAVLVDGFPLGGGKASGGRIKNHYPKGLRSLQ